MTISSIMNAGLTALQASQTAMRVASQNIANANTAGYVRTDVTLSPLNDLGLGGGVQVSGIKRAADQFLATAAYIANANSGAAGARSDLLARAQSYFGDPNSDSSVFASIDNIWSSLTNLQVDPSSTLSRDQAVSAMQNAFDQIGNTATAVQSLVAEADSRISTAVDGAQSLMNQIASLNDQIRLTKRAGADSSAVENSQSALIDQLSQVLDIRVDANPDGGVNVRTSGGAPLVGAQASQISYTPNGGAYTTHGVITLNAQNGSSTNLEPYVLSGELKGLLQARDTDLPSLAEALGGFAGALADNLNAVHNENASTPAVGDLTGRDTGLLSTDALNFTGKATIGVVDSSGALQQRLSVDFTAGTITGAAPAATYNFSNTIGSFTTALNSALGAATPAGTATFTNGVMALNVGSGGGLVIQQDATTPSARAGRGFSHFFGLNDIASRDTPYFFEAGVSGTDLAGLNAGGQIAFQVTDGNGRLAATRTVTISGALAAPGATLNDLVTALNTPGTGLGEYATFAIDSTTGRLTMTPRGGFKPVITSDSTTRGTTGVSLSSLFGLSSGATAARALEINVSQSVSDDPGSLAVGRPDLTAAIGTTVIEAGDNRGAAALVNARDKTTTFPAAGALSAQSTTLGLYASRLGGAAGRMASEADDMAKGAAAVASAATDRRGQVEGVNMDEELAAMTQYQNSYAAAARVIQAANAMFDILFNIGTPNG